MPRPVFAFPRIGRKWQLSVFLLCAGMGCSHKETELEVSTPAAPAVEAKPTLTAADSLKASDECLKKQDLNGAVLALSEALKQDPKCTEAYVRRAAILADSKYFPQAISDLSAAIPS